jgi:hypothetical protein
VLHAAYSQARAGGPPAPAIAAPAAVPAVVAIPPPSAADVEAARGAFATFLESDAATRTLVQKYPGLLEVRSPQPNTAIVPALAPQFQAKHQANLEVAKAGGRADE